MEETNAARSTAADSSVRVLACSGSLDGGGSERQLWQLVSHLDRRRLMPEVCLLKRRGVYLDQLPADVAVHAFDDQYPLPSSFPPGRISWLQARYLRAIVQSRAIDVVYDRTYHMTLVTGRLPRQVPRVSVIVSPPGRDVAQNERRFRWLKRRMLARAYTSAACTICVSQEVARDAAHYYRLPLEQFTVLPNPVDVRTITHKSLAELPQSAAILGSKNDAQIHAAVIGRFTAEKGHASALELAARWRAQYAISTQPRELHLHFIGNGPLENALRQQTQDLGLTNVVWFHGYQTNPYPILAACDLALIPSHYEGFPNVALEAMALGVPLVMNNYGETAMELAGNQQQRARLIDIADLASAAHILADSLQHLAQWRGQAASAQDWIMAHHAFEPWLETMSCLFERLAARRPR